MNKFLSLSLIMSVSLLSKAQNPIIRDQFSGDPTARVFNNRVYLYPSHDIIPPADQRQDWFCMEDYHVFSSENLTDWTDHGVIVTQNKVPWVRPDSYSMWAPDCVYRNGKYYFYFPSAQKSGKGFGIGVAIADSPEGPFIPEPEPIKDLNGIDPCVLIASDGNAYIFWGAGRCAKLKDNMKELADDTPKEKVKWGDREFEMMGVNCLKDLPSRQAEGPFAFEYNGNYYLTYSYVRENTEVLGYAMSKNPMGPYEYKGLIMAEQPNGCWTNHHSIIKYKGQWYLFYHRNDYSPRDDKRRSVCIDKMIINPDGSIQEVKPTMRGVGINDVTEKIEIDRYSEASNDVTTQLVDMTNPFRSFEVTIPNKRSWIKYNDVDFSRFTNGYISVCAKTAGNTKLYFRDKTAKGKIIAIVDMADTKPKTDIGTSATSYHEFNNQWRTFIVPLAYTPKGVTDLVVTCEGNTSVSVDWIQFKERPEDINNKLAILTWSNTIIESKQKNYELGVSVQSDSKIEDIKISVNGTLDRGIKTVNSSNYDLTINCTLTLNEGTNVIKVSVKNAAGTTQEEKTIVYRPQGGELPTIEWLDFPVTANKKEYQMKLGIKSKTKVEEVNVTVNGALTRGIKPVPTDGYDLKVDRTLALSEGVNRIVVSVRNGDGIATSEKVITYQGINPTPIFNDKRIALVMGNANYNDSDKKLNNPVNDATDFANKLEGLGFTVIRSLDQTKKGMETAINEFGQKAGQYDVALFYYAGHGIRCNGDNFLVPIDADLPDESFVEYNCTNANLVLSMMDKARCPMKIVILDACRNNPFARSWHRSTNNGGLNMMHAPKGTFIAFSTGPGDVANDGIGQRNSPYTLALLQTLDIPNLSITDFFQRVGAEVMRATKQSQTPWTSSSFIGNFYFNKQ